MTIPVKLRPEIVALAAYRQGKPASDDAFKLSSNENPFEPIPEVIEAIVGASGVNRYPNATGLELRGAIAERFGVSAGQVHLGAGSVAIIAQLIQAAAGAGDEVLYAWRSFEAYPGLVSVAGASSVQVPVTADGRHDLFAMTAAITDRTRVVIVCTPNNPSSTIVTAEEFTRFMGRVPADVLVLLDEAYAEFVTDPSAVDGRALTGRYPNLVVLRTFSKAYGLAGLRIGYAVGPEYILDAARSTAIPLSVTEPSQRAALVSLLHEDVLLERVARIAVLRDRVWSALVDQGWSVPVPQGNFVWLPTGERTVEATEVFERHGLVVRPFAPEGIRISIGESESVDKLLKAAQEVVGNLTSSAGAPALD
ncbi:MAG TPA: histidinol-phosphate transaminase [Lacisediminihabitans sp.]|uniref:histidinol-phosphate transaminase n=1 Tax=Lacisediminihabitans sp. TaxID=2787631 RepID=UPI002ED83C20